MSVDYDLVCDTCQKKIHLGQISAGLFAFGFASFDLQGRARLGEFIARHSGDAVHAGASLRVTTDGPGYPEDVGLLSDATLDAYRERASHALMMVAGPTRRLAVNCRHEHGIYGTGMSVLEAVGDYAVKRRLVKFEMEPSLPLDEQYRLDPKVNAAKLVFKGQDKV